MFAEPEFWVAVAFFILMGVFAYVGVHRTVLKALDHRSERIKTELDDARRLKEEAAKLLAEYKTRQASAERQARGLTHPARPGGTRGRRTSLLPRSQMPTAPRPRPGERGKIRSPAAPRPPR